MTTTHYGFKLFESTDKPTWLENWNQTMTDIDQALYNISTGGGDLPDLTEVVQRIQALEGRMTSAELRLNEDEGAISDLQDSVEELSGLASRLSTLESTVANNTSRISSVETDLGTVTNTDIPTLQSGVAQAQAQNTTQDQQISGLDTRVQALENSSAPSSMLQIFAANMGTSQFNLPDLDTAAQSCKFLLFICNARSTAYYNTVIIRANDLDNIKESSPYYILIGVGGDVSNSLRIGYNNQTQKWYTQTNSSTSIYLKIITVNF